MTLGFLNVLQSPTAVAVVVGFLVLSLGALLVFRVTEGSRSKAKRRLGKSTKKTVAAGGFGVVGVAVAVMGVADAGADVLGELFGLVASHPAFLVNLGLGALATGIASGALSMPATTTAAVVGVIILVGVAWGRA